jgi:two-component system chemotaxis sensor kinase CheA
MEQLSASIEQLAAAVVMAKADDLPALAAIHDHLKALHKDAQSVPAPVGPHLTASAGAAETLVERMILREAGDDQAAMRQLEQHLKEFQGIVEGRFPSNSGSGATLNAPSPPPAAPGAPEEDQGFIPDPAELPLITEFVAEAGEHIETAETALLKIEEQPDDPDAVNTIFRAFHTIKGVAGYLNLKQIGSLAHVAENLLDLARQGKLQLRDAAVDVVLETIDLLKSMVRELDQAIKNGGRVPPEKRLAGVLQRIGNVISGDGGANAAAIAPVAIAQQQPQPTATATEQPAVRESVESTKATAVEKPRESVQAGVAEATVKVATNRLDSLINAIGELTIACSMVSRGISAVEGIDPKLLRGIGHLGKITRELQDLAMSIRMVPVQSVLQRMSRIVRDLARKTGKQVELVIEGGDTELDRNLVDALGDPLVHMIRNSVDHGIESPDERIKAGKPPTGKVHVKARHQAGNIVIEIADDGKGLPTQKILRKAIQAGIVQEGQQLSEQEIFKLIFHPGLSTAEKVTDVSGRGVGMDVVRKNVEALRGRVDITSVQGRGSTFTIRLPLTLAVIDGLVVKASGHSFILPITNVEQTIQLKPEQLSTVQNRGRMCMVRDRLLPLHRLDEVLGAPPSEQGLLNGLLVVVHDHEQSCGLYVDELLGQEQVVIKSLGGTIGGVPGIAGGAIRGDGDVSLIIDVSGLIRLASNAQQAAAVN